MPVEEAADGAGEDAREERPADGDDAGRWTERIEHEEGVKIRQLTFVEMVESRRGPLVLQAVAKIYARLRFMGLPVLRLHSDRASELRSRQMAQWCMHRDLYRTFTDGDSWQMNGRAEAEVGTISRQTKTLLSRECPPSSGPWQRGMLLKEG